MSRYFESLVLPPISVSLHYGHGTLDTSTPGGKKTTVGYIQREKHKGVRYHKHPERLRNVRLGYPLAHRVEFLLYQRRCKKYEGGCCGTRDERRAVLHSERDFRDNLE